MKKEDQYLQLLKRILQEGKDRTDRTGVGVRGIFGETLRFSLENNTLPLLTTKRIYWKGVVEELLFFIRGETDTKKLEEVGVNIWKGNTTREFLDSRGLTHLPEGDMGKGYGYQWRRFGEDGERPGVDQLKEMLRLIKENPTDRRIIMSAWNPQQLNQCALPPCHTLYQCWVDPKERELSASFYMRSVDCFLGAPFNFASYGLLTHLLAKSAGLKAKELVWMGGDVHIYRNHFAAVEQQIEREPMPFPQILIDKPLSSIEDIEGLSFSDIQLIGYNPQPTIKAEMAV